MPWLLGLIFLTAFPMGFALWMSFTNYDGISPNTRSVGWANYARAFSDSDLATSLRITLILMLIVVPLGVFAGLSLALLANRNLREKGVYRALLYLPAVIPITAGALAFRMMFDQDVGPINGLLSKFGLDVVPWLTGGQAIWVMLAFMLWGAGGSMVISLAALQSVPQELLEAAMVDGASPFNRLVRITLPMISPILLFQVVTGVIGAIQLFIPAMLMGNARVGTSVTDVPEGLRVYMLYVYQTYFAQNDFGYASAMLWLLFIVIMAFTALIFVSSRRFVYYASEGE